MLSEEAEHPYDRPPLSKDVLLKQDSSSTVLLSPEEAEASDIDVRLSNRVVGLDLEKKRVAVQDHAPVPYGSLVVATGTRARSLPTLRRTPGVQYLRTSGEATAIRERLSPGSRITIVGAGFIGLEVAAAARSRGCAVTVVELAPRPLHGPLGDSIASWLEEWHAARGVDFRCGVSVVSADTSGGGLEVRLSDSAQIESDLVVVGVGVMRELDWMSSAGLRTHPGLVCDAGGRAPASDVYGAGDIVCVHDRDDCCSPVQHWTAAADSAQRVARTLVGLPPETEFPEDYFWSNQAELRLMSVGHPPRDVAPQITSGDLGSGKFVAVWDVDGRVTAVLGANSPKEFFRERLAFRSSADQPSA